MERGGATPFRAISPNPLSYHICRTPVVKTIAPSKCHGNQHLYTSTKAPPRTHTTSMMSPTLTSTGPMCCCVDERCCLVGGVDSRWTMGGPSKVLRRTDACLLTPEQWRRHFAEWGVHSTHPHPPHTHPPAHHTHTHLRITAEICSPGLSLATLSGIQPNWP